MKASYREIVATDGSQGHEAKASAKSTLEKLMRGDHDGPIEDA